MASILKVSDGIRGGVSAAMAERGSLNIEAYHEPGEIERARAL
jgi:hypothetical protein